MEPLEPGNYWKTPFYWEPGSPSPPSNSRLTFQPVSDDALRPMIAAVMAASLDGSDQFNVSRLGAETAAQEVFDLLAQDFHRDPGWWRVGTDEEGRAVGFILPVTFRKEKLWKDGRPLGTILYMGVLPEFRGHGYGLDLVHEATRVLGTADCWRIFCDTGSDNTPVIQAFRRAGFTELKPWQQPLA